MVFIKCMSMLGWVFALVCLIVGLKAGTPKMNPYTI